MTRILVFGDSIAWGAWDTEGGWVQRINSYILNHLQNELGHYNCIYNLGVVGNTSEHIAKRFDIETKYTISKNHETIIIFAFGINDHRFTERPDKPEVSEKRFLKNVALLYRQAKKYTTKIIFVGPTPVYEPKTSPWFQGIYFSNKGIKRYDDIIRDFCAKNSIIYIGLFEKFMKLDLRRYIEDGLHPNSKGHNIIFRAVLAELRKNKMLLKNQ
jgi:lysophospholipase L1-like esterase